LELLTISKEAKKLGVHPNSLRNWEKQGLIKPVRLPGGQRRYSVDELNRLLQSGQLTDGQGAVVLYARVSMQSIHSVNHIKTFVPPGKNSIKTGIINYYLWLSNGNLFIIEILIN